MNKIKKKTEAALSELRRLKILPTNIKLYLVKAYQIPILNYPPKSILTANKKKQDKNA